MGRNYWEDFPEWVKRTKRESDVRGWIIETFDDPWEGKRAMLDWFKNKNKYVRGWRVLSVRKVIEMKNRLRALGYF